MSLLGAYRLYPQIQGPTHKFKLCFTTPEYSPYTLSPLFRAAQKRQLQTTRRRPILPRPKQSVPLFSFELFLICIGPPIHASQLTSSNHCPYCCALSSFPHTVNFPFPFPYYSQSSLASFSFDSGLPCRSGQLGCSNLLHILCNIQFLAVCLLSYAKQRRRIAALSLYT
ncbi:uncharacterized protein BDV14DRAFT_88894 [Aspergillus stella-maris]|uniref:uncharacterized protein n=1 Tax=Aspergillus stella-maris TaxID=1810926 RepID=UPI003CCCDA29